VSNSNTISDIKPFFQECQNLLDSILEQELDKTKIVSKRLSDAIHYSIFNGGKRFRPTLCYATAIALDSKPENVNCVAAAIELVHCYSLVHDDLPAMDDDDLRRGKPTCHIAFDEATAILVGDALQAYAFQLLAQINPEISSQQKLRMLTSLAIASGSEGVAAGQALDLASTNQHCELNELERIHQFKTGKIISACIDLSAQALHEDNSDKHKALQEYAQALGLAFQVKDDILDVEASTEILGKTQGADQALNKSTYPNILGLEKAKELAESLHTQALQALSDFDDEADLLRALSDYVIHREN
jgi:geranylgeranyl pyrophosphate synthase